MPNPEKILLHPTYFPSIEQMAAIAQAAHVVFEVQDNYQKQTYRNRAYIAHSNGSLLLNVPVKHNKEGRRQKSVEVLAENNFPWQSHHWKSLQSAYRTSPFFEFYEDDLAPLFTKPANNLLKHNLAIFELLRELIGLETESSKSETFEVTPQCKDLRFLAIAKREVQSKFTPYIQVLEAQHGFLPNLSVLDLLFNEGPNTLSYLESQVELIY
ncbi:WbqC-like protein [Ulvibacter sp. MAR_2010_11]|uniref:WbqC family protein n=1 Tax=Ulvibacter sp. MAR_2010_11 TaxID=1250229 RepID=UPI000CBF09AD|nr:WbqC family protein [Ulvibacter sp. MAR_2010_11]PKA83801.1 WbqC-like protein [Ulvibacter sp. MAR_2010_11]